MIRVVAEAEAVPLAQCADEFRIGEVEVKRVVDAARAEEGLAVDLHQFFARVIGRQHDNRIVHGVAVQQPIPASLARLLPAAGRMSAAAERTAGALVVVVVAAVVVVAVGARGFPLQVLGVDGVELVAQQHLGARGHLRRQHLQREVVHAPAAEVEIVEQQRMLSGHDFGKQRFAAAGGAIQQH